MAITVHLGNPDPNPDLLPPPEEDTWEGERWVEVSAPEEASVRDVFVGITDKDGLWKVHSRALSPSWVAASDPGLESLLCMFYDCPAKPVAGVNT
jgi:hypothetical protein